MLAILTTQLCMVGGPSSQRSNFLARNEIEIHKEKAMVANHFEFWIKGPAVTNTILAIVTDPDQREEVGLLLYNEGGEEYANF